MFNARGHGGLEFLHNEKQAYGNVFAAMNLDAQYDDCMVVTVEMRGLTESIVCY